MECMTTMLQIQVLVDRKDGGNMMNAQSLQELAAVNRLIVENVTASNGHDIIPYRDMCGIYCNDSNAFVIGLVQVVVVLECMSKHPTLGCNAIEKQCIQFRVVLPNSPGSK